MVNSMEVSQKTKNRTTIWSSNSTPGYYLKKNENTNLKRYMHPTVHSSTIYRQPKCPSTDEGIKMWYTHTHTHTHIWSLPFVTHLKLISSISGSASFNIPDDDPQPIFLGKLSLRIPFVPLLKQKSRVGVIASVLSTSSTAGINKPLMVAYLLQCYICNHILGLPQLLLKAWSHSLYH